MNEKSENQEKFGLLGISGYVPRLRLKRDSVAAGHRWMAPGLRGYAKGTRSMANWDEDTITMGVEAGRRVLSSDIASEIGSLSFASTTLPFGDRLNSSIVRSALRLDTNVESQDVCGGLRAASTSLLKALKNSKEGNELIIASDRRIPKPASPSEMLSGDGAAAVVTGFGEPIAKYLSSATITVDFVDHFRETGTDADYGWEERWVRDTGYAKIIPPVVNEALQLSGLKAADIDHFVMSESSRRVPQFVAKKLGVNPDAVADTLFEYCGETGVAHSLLILARTLSKAKQGEKILLVQFGSGCDVIILEATGKGVSSENEPTWFNQGVEESNYLKYLSFTNQISLEWGMRAEMDNKTALSAAWRAESMVNGFTGGVCSACGTVQFPASRICVNPECYAEDTQSPHELINESAKVKSFTCDWLSYKPCPPFLFGHVEFDSEARVLMEFTDCEPEDLQVGVPLEMVFRIKELDSARGFRRYFWKAKPQLNTGEA